MTNKFEMAKERLVIKAANYAAQYLLNKYGEAHLIGEPIVELTSTVDPDSSSLLFNGKITVSAAGLLNNVNVDMTVNSNEIEVDSETSVQSKIESAVNAQQELEPVKASLGGFRLVDNGTTYLEVSHADLQNAKLGVLGKNEYATSKDRAALLQGILKDALLESKVSFTGEFKEPTIEKTPVVKIAKTEFPGGECAKCGKDVPLVWGETWCKECSDKKEAKKSSWLTADLDVAAAAPYFQDLSEDAQAMIMENVAGHLGGNVPQEELSEEIDHFINIHNDGASIGAMLNNDFSFDKEASPIAIKEDMPMARAADHIAQEVQSEDQSMLAAQLKVEHEAANQLISVLQGMGYGTAKTVEITSSKEGFDIMTAIDDAGAVKAVSIPVTVKEGKVVLPKKALISTLISKGLDVQAKLAEQFDLEVLEKLAAIEERMVYESAEAEAILSEKPVTKQAAGEKQPFFDSDDSTLTVQKHLLPNHEKMKVGDKFSDGVDQWELVNTDGQQNSKGEGDSSIWTMKKCQNPERSNEEPKNKMPI